MAVIDSGVNVPHPHLPSVAGGLGIDFEGNVSDDYVDRLGHGTAAAAAIHEKAPEAELWAIKVFDEELATTVATLVQAIDWAAEHGCRLVNLSLGTPNEFRREELAPAVARSVERGAIVVSAFEHQGVRWFPGSMSGALGVVMDSAHARESLSARRVDGHPVLVASPYARPIPGVPLERNLNGISYAVANAVGVLARLLEDNPGVCTAREALRLVERSTG